MIHRVRSPDGPLIRMNEGTSKVGSGILPAERHVWRVHCFSGTRIRSPGAATASRKVCISGPICTDHPRTRRDRCPSGAPRHGRGPGAAACRLARRRRPQRRRLARVARVSRFGTRLDARLRLTGECRRVPGRTHRPHQALGARGGDQALRRVGGGEGGVRRRAGRRRRPTARPLWRANRGVR
jgi:hypothetical protein